MSPYTKNIHRKNLYQYPNTSHKDFLKAERSYGLTELKLDTNLNWLLVHNSSLNQVDIIDLNSQTHLKTCFYQELAPKLKAHKGMDIYPSKHWLLVGGQEDWLVWDYQKEIVVQQQTLPDTVDHQDIVGIHVVDALQELWVLSQDVAIFIYDLNTWELVAEIPVQGSYSRPLTWHPDGNTFLYAEMEQGGSRLYVGDARARTIDKQRFVATDSYIIATASFTPDGQYIVFSDAGIRVFEFPSLTTVYSFNDAMEMALDWESPRYPEAFPVLTSFMHPTTKCPLMLHTNGDLGTSLALSDVATGEEHFYCLPLPFEFSTKIEGLILGETPNCCYFSDYLGGIHRLEFEIEH